MAINPEQQRGEVQGWQSLTVAAGLLGALAASSCCILPLVLFSLGVSGAWIGILTQLAPYQPYFIIATIIFLGAGYWLSHRSSKLACTHVAGCAHALPTRIIGIGLSLATILVAAALGFNFLAPLFLPS